MSLSQKSNKKHHELSFTQKCIILANVQTEKDKNILTPFSFIPVVKLYTATPKQETFIYTKVKGGLFLLEDKNQENKKYYIRIYDSKDYSLRFNLEIDEQTKKNYVKIESNFYCFNLKMGCLGFLFSSSEEAEKFKNLFDAKTINQSTKIEYDQYNSFPLKDSDNAYLDVIDNMIEKLGKKYQDITFGEEFIQEITQISEYLIFSGFLELSQLLNNMEYDTQDQVFNLFIDKKFNQKLFNKIFRSYNHYYYPIRPISHDYLNIYNKSNYVDILVGHLINNFKEQVRMYKKRKDYNAKQKGEARKNISGNESGIIEEDPNEDEGCYNMLGKFFSGLNPFK